MYFGHEVFPWNLHQNFCYKLESGWLCGFFNTIVSNIKGIKITLQLKRKIEKDFKCKRGEEADIVS